jgi:hypothetical protein
MLTRKTALAGLLCLPLGACGVAARVQSRADYQQSEASYKACLMANAATPQNCEGLRLAMEADERKFTHMSGPSANANLTILNR